MSRKAVISWSSGKDAAYALWEAQRGQELEIVGALTTLSAAEGRVSMHGVRDALLDQQLTALSLPCSKVPLPWPCSNEAYERAMGRALAALRRRGVCDVLFGDLFLEDIRHYREAHLASLGMRGVFPLWKRDTRELARQMIDEGIGATVVCVDPRKLDRAFAGRPYDHALLDDLPDTVDPCGENGEFHTAVTASPSFSAPISFTVGERYERDGFVYADLLVEPGADAPPATCSAAPVGGDG